MKVAIIHDWLNGMRGGELVLDSLLKVYPSADLFTLFYTPGKLNPRIEQEKSLLRLQTSFRLKNPSIVGIFLCFRQRSNLWI